MSTNDSGMLPPPPGPTGPVGPPPAPVPAPDFLAAAPGSTSGDAPATQPQEAPAAPASGAPNAPGYGTPAAPEYGTPAAPAYGTPAAPAYGTPAAQPYGGHPAAPTLPPEAAYGGYPGTGAPQGQRKGLVIAALVVSVVALLLSWVPVVNYVAAVLAVVGLVLGIVGLVGAVRHGRPGKGMAIGAVVVSAVSLLVVVLTGIAYSLVINEVVDGLEGAATQLEAEVEEPVVADEEDAPASDGPVAEGLGVVEMAFGQSSYDAETWWYVVIVENPNPEHAMRSAGFDIEAIGADGTILDTSSAYVDLLPGRVALTGSFLSVGSSAVDHLDVRGPDMAEAEHEPDLGAFAIADVAAVTDEWSTTVGGTLSGSFAEELSSVKVEVVARNAQGQIIGSDVTYVDRLPAGGQARFEVMFFDPLPADTTFEAFAML